MRELPMTACQLLVSYFLRLSLFQYESTHSGTIYKAQFGVIELYFDHLIILYCTIYGYKLSVHMIENLTTSDVYYNS